MGVELEMLSQYQQNSKILLFRIIFHICWKTFHLKVLLWKGYAKVLMSSLKNILLKIIEDFYFLKVPLYIILSRTTKDWL